MTGECEREREEGEVGFVEKSGEGGDGGREACFCFMIHVHVQKKVLKKITVTHLCGENEGVGA